MEAVRLLVVHLEGVEGEDHPQAILLDLALVALMV
jgi:hypothetical protein